MTQLQRATTERFLLAEGPVWDAPRRRVLWVDIHAGLVVEARYDGARISIMGTYCFAGTVGAVAVADDGALLVATSDGLVLQRGDGVRTRITDVLPPGSNRRLNDGATDPAGRFLVGSLNLGGSSEAETLVRLEPDGSLTILDTDLTLSNGLAWTVDGRQMFSVDTERRTVFVRDYDAASGAVGSRRVHLVLDDGYPDGIAMDADDHLWMAVWGLGEVRRYDPRGDLVETLETGAPHTSSIAFIGDDLRTLIVTTASADLTEKQRQASPNSGHLLATRREVPGASVPAWSGLHKREEQHTTCT